MGKSFLSIFKMILFVVITYFFFIFGLVFFVGFRRSMLFIVFTMADSAQTLTQAEE